MKLIDKVLTAIIVGILITFLIWSFLPILVMSPIIGGIALYYTRRSINKGTDHVPHRNYTE